MSKTGDTVLFTGLCYACLIIAKYTLGYFPAVVPFYWFCKVFVDIENGSFVILFLIALLILYGGVTLINSLLQNEKYEALIVIYVIMAIPGWFTAVYLYTIIYVDQYNNYQ